MTTSSPFLTNRKMALPGVFAALLMVSSGWSLQQANQAKQQPASGPSAAQLHQVFVTVRDKKDRIVTDLSPEEFRVFEMGQERKIEQFARDTAVPLLLGVAVDTSGSGRVQMPGKEGWPVADLFRDVLQGHDLAFLVSFADTAFLEAHPTNDVEELVRATYRLADMPRKGSTALYDTIYATCGDEMKGQPGRKVLVVVSDFQDNNSRKKLQDVIDISLETGTAVFPVVLQPTGEARMYSGSSAMRTARHSARRLAEASGGRIHIVETPTELRKKIAEIAEELRRQYAIGFAPLSVQAKEPFRKLKVETTRKGLRVTAPQGYYP